MYTAWYRLTLGIVLASASLAHGVERTENTATRDAINALISPDPAKRDEAAKSLLEIGADARQAVLEASRSEDPELRARASELLMRLPWQRSDDSPAVQELLKGYGRLDVDRRKAAVVALSQLAQHGHDALVRLIQEEPSDDVKWEIAAVVRQSFRGALLDAFRQLDTHAESAPLLAAAGHAWLPTDVAKGAKLLKIALQIDLEHPANDGGEVEAAFDRLDNLARLDGRFDEVASLLRLRARRGAIDYEGEPSAAVLDLFAAHANYGPLAGFDQDLKTYRAHLQDPRIMFALGKVYQRSGQAALAAATFRAAYLVDMTSIADRFDQGNYLVRQGWLDLAEGEFATLFDLAPDHSAEYKQAGEGVSPEIVTANAHFRMAQLAVARQDDKAAADQLRSAMYLHDQARGQLRGATPQSLHQDILWHDLRAARAKGDQSALAQIAGSLATAASQFTNSDIANDLVPILRNLGREKEAQTVFDEVYDSIRAVQVQRPGHPMPDNNLAWLCARCGEHKEQALKLALEATRAMPDNAAFLDTLAEAHFQLGHFKEAARLEAKVVAARPNDHFLRDQLKRFNDAAKAHDR